MLKRILYPIEKQAYRNKTRGEDCPECKVATILQQISCPDPTYHCAVYHSGWVCPRCKAEYERVAEDSDLDGGCVPIYGEVD